MAEFEGMAKALQIPQGVIDKIEAIDKKINTIASDSEKMAAHFMSAMTRMGNDADTLLRKLQAIQGVINGLGSVNVSSLGNISRDMGNITTRAEKAAASISEAAAALNKYGNVQARTGQTNTFDKERKEYVERYKMYERMFDQIERVEQRRIAAEQRAAQAAEKARQREQAASERAARQAERDAERKVAAEQRAAQAAERAAERAAKAQAREDSRNRRLDYQSYVTSTEGSLRTADKAVTYMQREQAIKNLEAAMKRLRTTDANYQKDLSRLTASYRRLTGEQEKFRAGMGRIARSQSQMMNIGQQLTRQLALVFSVSAIQGYINKLVEVRGEFELQQTALASILQNKDQADQLFAQITELAVHSPFTIKELNSYTKQLAAYQVQYEDLYNTTKMLADVSSGLGVDMSRLILAFGQVKAANILRGTEVRQFTEAGLNILGELAKYYSELEGRMISVGEVQERVTRRMVSFGDVEEVFKRVTSAGGMFYNMQEQQANTIRGQMMNLQDQIDLMLNDIGKSNQGIIITVISLLKSIIENWEGIYNVMGPIVGMLTSYILLTNKWVGVIPNLRRAWQHVNEALTSARLSLTAAGREQSAFNKQAAANGWLLVGLAVIAIIVEVKNAIEAANKKQKEYNKIVHDGWIEAEEAATRFKVLAKTVTDVTATYDKQKSALDELRRSYSDILPQQQLTAEGIRSMAGDYDAATRAIREYYKVQTEAKLMAKVNENYAEDIANETDALLESTYKYLRENAGLFIDKETLRPAIEEFRRQLEEGIIDVTNNQEIRDAFAGLLRVRLPELPESQANLPENASVYLDIWHQILDLNDIVNDKLREQNRVLARNAEFTSLQGEQLNKQKDILDANIKQMKNLMNTIANYGKDPLVTEQQVKDAKNKLSELLKNYGVSAEEIADLTNDAWQIRQSTIDFNKRMLQSFIDWVNKEFQSQDSFIGRFIQGLTSEKAELENSPTQQYIQDLIQSAAELNNIDMSNFIGKLIGANETVDDYIKRLKSALDSAKADIEKYEISPNLVPHIGTEQQFEELKKEAAVIESVLSIISPQKDSGKTGNKENERLKEQINLIKQAKKAYEDYLKLYDEDTATQLTRKAFMNAFRDLGLNVEMDFDVSSVIDAIQALMDTAGDAGNKYINQQIAQLRTDENTKQRTAEVEEYRKQIDELFQSLSNYQEFEKLGLNKDLISRIFGINTSSIQDVQDAFDMMKSELKGYGEEGEKLIADSEKKITDAQQKELKDRLAQYAEFMRNSISERAKIEIEAQKEISKIQATQGMTQPMKDASIQNVRQRANEQISKLDWQDFQNSDVYTRLFQDLEYVSTSALKRIKANLDTLKDSMSNLTPEQLKSINEYYSKLDEQISTRNPFVAMRDSLKEIKALKSEGRTEEVLNNELIMYDQQAQTLKTQISDLETIIGMKQEDMSLDSLSSDLLQRNADILGKSTDELRMQLSLKKGELSQVQTNIGISSKDLQSYAKARKDMNNLAKEINDIRSLGKTAFGNIMDILDSMGVETDNTAGTIAELSASLVDIAAQAVLFGIQLQLNTVLAQAMGVAINSALGPIGWAVIALQALTSIFTAFSRIHDNKREKKIQKELDLVDNLQDAYEKLEKAIDDAYTLDTLKESSDNARENLEQQKEALEEAIRLEEDKKKTDEDRIKEWEQQIDDIDEQLEELAEETFSKITGGILDDVLSAADEFTDAWLEAFQETGDGMQGLEENFKEMIADMLKRQAAMQITSSFVEKWKEQLQKYLNEDDMKLTTDEAKKWADSVKSSLPALNESLENYFKALENAGIDLSGDDGDTLSGLQKGIQSITEETAQALEALLSSIRFFVSQQNVELVNIRQLLTTPPTDNPFYQELQSQTEYLRLIYSLFTSLSTNGQGGGKILKVKIY